MEMAPITQNEAKEYDEELMRINPNILSWIEVAGFSACEPILEIFGRKGLQKDSKIGIMIGPGNNGGDGLVIAKYLHFYEYNVAIHYKSVRHQSLLDTCEYLGIPVYKDNYDFSKYDIIIDAVFGVGFTGELKGVWLDVFKNLNDKFIISIDVPSGHAVDSKINQIFNPSYVVCFVAPKICSEMYDTYVTRLFGPPFKNVKNFSTFVRVRKGD